MAEESGSGRLLGFGWRRQRILCHPPSSLPQSCLRQGGVGLGGSGCQSPPRMLQISPCPAPPSLTLSHSCINVLLELIATKVNYVVQEAVVVIKDIFRWAA